MNLADIEDAVHQAWAAELKTDRPGPDSNFFLVGGNSLVAVRMMKRLSAMLGTAVPLQAFFRHPTPAGLAGAIADGQLPSPAQAAAPGTQAPPSAAAAPLPAPVQLERLQSYGECAIRSDPVTYQVRLSGALQPGRLEWALRYVTGRHDGLLMRFATDIPASALTGGPEDLPHVQVTLGDPQADAVAFDVVTIDGPEREPAAISAALKRFAGREFDLAHGPRVRALLLRLEPEEWIFALSVDHITFDLVSLEILLEDLAAVYTAGEDGAAAAVLGPAPSYREFAERQWAMLAAPQGQGKLEYWVDIYRRAGIFPDARLAALGGEHAGRPGKAKVLALPLPGGTPDRLRQEAAQCGTTPFNMVVAAFLLSLRQRVCQDLLGAVVPLANRTEPGSERLVGLLATVLPIWVDLAGVTCLPAAAAKVTEATLAAIDNCLPALTSGHAYLSGAFGVGGHPAYADPSRRAGGPTIELFVEEPGIEHVLRLPGLATTPYDVPISLYRAQGGLMAYAAIGGTDPSIAFLYPDDAYNDRIMTDQLEDMRALLSAGERS